MTTKGRACTGKVARTKAEAKEHVRFLRSRLVKVQAYKCRHCGSWHVGHRPRYRGQR